MQTLGGAISTFFAPSLRRTLLLRALTIGLVPIVLIVALALAVSQRLLQERFDDEARLVAGATASAIIRHLQRTERSDDPVDHPDQRRGSVQGPRVRRGRIAPRRHIP